MDLSKVRDREALSARREPHWQRIRPGCFLGYRPSVREGAGTWIARAYEEDGRRYRLKALGSFGELLSRDRFSAAKDDAESFADVIAAGGHQRVAIETIEEACREYVKVNAEADGRFKRHVYGDPIAKLKLAKLRRHHLLEWRDRLQKKPAMVSRSKRDPVRTRPRSPSSLNRDMGMLRAALNRVLPPGRPDTDAAWQEALRRVRNADKQRTLRLSREQRKALLSALPDDAAAFVRALCLMPLRPGAVATLNAGDYDKRSRELTIGKDKSGRPRRILLPPNAAELFAAHVVDKLPTAPLFSRADGARWNRDSWKRPIAAAGAAAGLHSSATAYTLRHSIISELVEAGLPLLTIAQISGTSVEMIERHYGHLDKEHAEKALAGLAL